MVRGTAHWRTHLDWDTPLFTRHLVQQNLGRNMSEVCCGMQQSKLPCQYFSTTFFADTNPIVGAGPSVGRGLLHAKHTPGPRYADSLCFTSVLNLFGGESSAIASSRHAFAILGVSTSSATLLCGGLGAERRAQSEAAWSHEP